MFLTYVLDTDDSDTADYDTGDAPNDNYNDDVSTDSKNSNIH